MSFKENLLTKIRIKALARDLIASMGSFESGKRTDLQKARELLDLSPYAHRKERDLDLYVQEQTGEKPRVVLLGNDLPLYGTTVADVVLRRSPTVKEMISIRNAIRILNDSDVLVSKGPQTVATIQAECVAMLDLFYRPSDLNEIAEEGRAALNNAYQDGVVESLTLFAELLDFRQPPNEMAMQHAYVAGSISETPGRPTRFGPMVLYSKARNDLTFIDESIAVSDKDKVKWVHRVARGQTPAASQGAEVFQVLVKAVLD